VGCDEAAKYEISYHTLYITFPPATRCCRLAAEEAEQHHANTRRFEELVRDYKEQVRSHLAELAEKESETTRLRTQLEYQVRGWRQRELREMQPAQVKGVGGGRKDIRVFYRCVYGGRQACNE